LFWGTNELQERIVKDNLDSLSSTTGQALVLPRECHRSRFYLHNPWSLFPSGSTNVFSNNAPFATVSDFKGITLGDISVSVKKAKPAINPSKV